MDNKVKIQDQKKVWVAWTNSDLTEGKGTAEPLVVCEFKATAIRQGKGRGVMGSNCRVDAALALKVGNRWLVPGLINKPSAADIKVQERDDRRAAIVERAQEAGFSDEEIALLSTQ